MAMEHVAVIGYGYVGKAIEKFFSGHFKVHVYDPLYMDAEKMGDYHERDNILFTRDRHDINSCDLAVVCVPTPKSVDGTVDLSIINDTIDWLNTPLILLKSTVPPGTTKTLVEATGKQIAFSPEYIGEGKYVVQWWKDKGYPHPTDMKYHDFQIFGGERKTTKGILQFFKRVLGPEPRYVQTDSTTAEVCKYMENSWGATKVTFVNEFYEIAQAFGIDYDELRELWLLDGRVERMHTAVFENKRGFGGKCFPKDVHGIVAAAQEAGYNPKFLRQVLRSNEEFSDKNPKE